MAKTIGQLTALAATPNAADEFVINDGGVTKKITATNVAAAAWELTGNKSLADTSNIVLGTSTGSKIGTDPLQKLGFYNATPVVQPALTADLLDSLQALGLVASGAGNTPLNLSAGALTAGATTATSVASTGAVTSSSATAGIGYATGAGGTVTQASNKTTGVTLDKSTGRITLHNATLNANTTVSFVLTSSAIAANDLLVLNHVSGGTAGAYTLNAQAAAGSASINVRNVTSGNLGEAIVIGFAVIKAVTA
jgi:hypothetical protein